MNLTVVLALVASGLAAPPAQRWSPAQQEIIEQIRRCNDAWVASYVARRFEVYDAVCPATDQALFWYTGSEAPVRYKGPDGLWARATSEQTSIRWEALQPVAVQVDGDIAYIYYSVTWIPQPKKGAAVPRPSRRLTIFQRRDGRWLMSGGSIAVVNN
jgi:ketosteroid isomerase-like protein